MAIFLLNTFSFIILETKEIKGKILRLLFQWNAKGLGI